MASDRRLAEELRLWDTTLLDGLDEEEDGPNAVRSGK